MRARAHRRAARPSPHKPRRARAAQPAAVDALLCAACRRAHDGRAAVVFCRGCSEWFHARCLGLRRGQEPPDEFWCSPCAATRLPAVPEHSAASSGYDSDYDALMADPRLDSDLVASPALSGDEALLSAEADYLRATVGQSDSLHEMDEDGDEAAGPRGRPVSSESDSVVHRMWHISDSDDDHNRSLVGTDVVYYLGQGWSTDSGEASDHESDADLLDRRLGRQSRAATVATATTTAATATGFLDDNDDDDPPPLGLSLDERRQLLISGLVLVRAVSPVLAPSAPPTPARSTTTPGLTTAAASPSPARIATYAEAAAKPPAPKPTPSSPPALSALMQLTRNDTSSLSSLPNSSIYKPLSSIRHPSLASLSSRPKHTQSMPTTPISRYSPLRPRDSCSPLPAASQPLDMSQALRSISESNAPLRIEDYVLLSSDDDPVPNASTTTATTTTTLPSHTVSLPGTPPMAARASLAPDPKVASSMLTKWDRIPIGAFRKSTRRRNSLPSLNRYGRAVRGAAHATLVSSSAAKRMSRAVAMATDMPPLHHVTSPIANGFVRVHDASELPSAVASPLHSPLFGVADFMTPEPSAIASLMLGEPAVPPSTPRRG